MAEGAPAATSEYAIGNAIGTHGNAAQGEHTAREVSRPHRTLGTGSDVAIKPQRKRNKPSLSCEACTVSVYVVT